MINDKPVILLGEDTMTGGDRFLGLVGDGFDVYRFDNIPDTIFHILDEIGGIDLVDCVVTNAVLQKNDEDGIRVLKCIRGLRPDMPVIIWSKMVADKETRMKYLMAGATRVIEKYVEDQDIQGVIRSLIKVPQPMEYP